MRQTRTVVRPFVFAVFVADHACCTKNVEMSAERSDEVKLPHSLSEAHRFSASADTIDCRGVIMWAVSGRGVPQPANPQ